MSEIFRIALNLESPTPAQISTTSKIIFNIPQKMSKVKVKVSTVLKQVPRIKEKVYQVKNKVVYVPKTVF